MDVKYQESSHRFEPFVFFDICFSCLCVLNTHMNLVFCYCCLFVFPIVCLFPCRLFSSFSALFFPSCFVSVFSPFYISLSLLAFVSLQCSIIFHSLRPRSSSAQDRSSVLTFSSSRLSKRTTIQTNKHRRARIQT